MNFPSVLPRVVASLFIPVCLPMVAAAQGEGDKVDNTETKGADAPEKAMKSFSIAPGLQADLWAAEPLLENPVAFSFDEQGRCFVAETNRRRTSVPDIRKNTEWLIQDLALRTVEDRIAFFKRTYPEGGTQKVDKDHADFNKDGHFDWRDWQLESEKVRLVEDRKGTGKADSASVYGDGFNTVATGIGAGVLARDGKVWYTCIPDVWLLEGNSGTSAKRTALATGFGVHVAYSGHDMHGVKMGPDGRIYWSIADTGAHVVTKEGKTIDVPDMGAVFRMNPDGTGMELFAKGLRNPQSLTFNDFGDLFTGDNNADGGDKARWLHIVEGGDYGWRMGWQFLPKLGAWNSEGLWDLNAGKTAAYLLPPVGHVGHGPAGIAYYPGTGLPDSYRDHYFYADFPGGVRSFAIQPHGASYTLDNPKNVLQDNTPKQMSGKLLWGLYPSDVGFNTNGGVYVLDWVFGWEKTSKGRIYRVHDTAVDNSPIVLETKKLLADGMARRSNDEMLHLLSHADQRVRLNAQFALAEKGEAAIPLLTRTARGEGAAPQADATQSHLNLLARLHAIWGLGQIAHHSPSALAPLAALLHDRDGEARAQAAKVLGEFKRKSDAPEFAALLHDPEPRTRFYAALAFSKIADPTAVKPLLELLRENGNQDAFIRHAASLALANCGTAASLATFEHDASAGVRMGVLLAMRHLQDPGVSAFLNDADAEVALEAVRAIHDEPIPAAIPALAALGSRKNLPAPITRRAINANYIIGTAAAAHTLADIAADASATEAVRLDALQALSDWNTDLGRDRVLGLYRPLPATRDANAAGQVAAKLVPQLLVSGSDALRQTAAETAGKLKLSNTEEALIATAGDTKLNGKLRAAALHSLSAIGSTQLAGVLKSALGEKDKAILEEARRLSAKLSPDDAAAQAAAVLEHGSISEQQGAMQTLGTLPPGKADKLITIWLDRLTAGQVAPAVRLDLLEAAAKREDPAIRQKLAAYESTRKSSDQIARWRECLEGGDATIGREIFAEKAEAACMRCHKIRGNGGDVGPDLGHIGSQRDREYLLTSIVLPNAMYAPGYETLLLTLKNGTLVAGLLTSEDANEITLTPVGGGAKTNVKKSDIAQRTTAPSPMPEGLGDVLGKRDLRNVVEYLSTLK